MFNRGYIMLFINMERIPALLLKSNHLHCRPVGDGPIIKADIVSFEDEQQPTFKVVVVCPVRRPSSKCQLREETEGEDGHCLYYRGDSCGEYQILGPGMGNKSDRGWNNE